MKYRLNTCAFRLTNHAPSPGVSLHRRRFRLQNAGGQTSTSPPQIPSSSPWDSRTQSRDQALAACCPQGVTAQTVAPAHTPPGVPRAGSPGKELPQPAASEPSDSVGPQGPGRHGPAWESGLAPELLAFQPAGGLPVPRSQNGHQGGPGGAERRTSCSRPFSRRSLDFQWAGSELIPVTMHSGTLTTNLI